MEASPKRGAPLLRFVVQGEELPKRGGEAMVYCVMLTVCVNEADLFSNDGVKGLQPVLDVPPFSACVAP